MTKIAFTACAHFLHDAKQKVWTEIAQHDPDHLLLLGDQIYMDFWGDSQKGWPAKPQLRGYELNDAVRESDPVFEQQMRLRYEIQFGIPSFQALVHQVLKKPGAKLGMIWDDHDFGTNNGYGHPGGPTNEADKLLSPTKLAIALRLAREFKANLLRLKAGTGLAYQAIPTPGDGGLWEAIEIGPALCLMLDTRTFRQSETPLGHAHPGSHILGQAQWEWLKTEATQTAKELVVVCSGSPFTEDGFISDQSWAQSDRKNKPYVEHARLCALAQQLHQAGKRMLFIGGDVHRVGFKPAGRKGTPHLPEVFCGGGAADRGDRGFGLLDLAGGHQALLSLFEGGRAEFKDRPVFAAALTPQQEQEESRTLYLQESVRRVEVLERAKTPAARPFSTRLLVTNRRLDAGDRPTDEATDTLSFFIYPGTQFQGRLHKLKKWDALSEGAFLDRLATELNALRQRPGSIADQVCVFIPGNRKSNAEAIAEYVEIDEMMFNAQGDGLGVCVLFDWATNDSNSFDFEGTYLDNIGRVTQAGQLMGRVLRKLRALADAQPGGARLTVLAHSLGNRVAVEAIAGLDAQGKPPVDLYMANAADLPADIFSTPQGAAVAARCGSVLVPYTAADQVLDFAAGVAGAPGDRLGRVGPRVPAPANVQSADLSMVCHTMDPHSGLFLSNNDWARTGREKGPFAVRFAWAMRDGRWSDPAH